MTMRTAEFRVQAWLEQHATGYRSIMDLGFGKSAHLQLIECPKKYAVDIWEPYVRLLREQCPDIEVIEGDFAEIDLPVAECVMMIDTIEHIVHERGWALLQRLQKTAQRIMVFTPDGLWDTDIDLQAHDLNPHQEHRSVWTLEEFHELGFETIHDSRFHNSWKGMYSPVDWGAIYAIWSRP